MLTIDRVDKVRKDTKVFGNVKGGELYGKSQSKAESKVKSPADDVTLKLLNSKKK